MVLVYFRAPAYCSVLSNIGDLRSGVFSAFQDSKSGPGDVSS